MVYNNGMNETEKTILTIAEFARLIRCSRKTVLRMIAEGRILAFKLSDDAKAHYRIKSSEVDRLISLQLNKTQNLKETYE